MFRFISAVANDGNITLTHPYLDPLGAGFIVTVSHTVRMDAAVGNDHKIYAVVGGDLTISSFSASLVKKLGKQCTNEGMLQCFLMDTSGYIIYHPNFENAYNDSLKVSATLKLFIRSITFFITKYLKKERLY